MGVQVVVILDSLKRYDGAESDNQVLASVPRNSFCT